MGLAWTVVGWWSCLIDVVETWACLGLLNLVFEGVLLSSAVIQKYGLLGWEMAITYPRDSRTHTLYF